MGNAFDVLIKMFYFSIFFAIPLAIWKVVDIIIWIIHHVNINVN